MTNPPSNEELARRAQRGDVQAFGLLYDRTARLARAVAADAGPEHADDVVHDAFLRAYRQLGTLKDPSKFAAWLVAITRLVVRERRRARKFETLPAELPDRIDANGVDPDPEDLLELVARLALIHDEGRVAWPHFECRGEPARDFALCYCQSQDGRLSLAMPVEMSLLLTPPRLSLYW